MAVILVEGITDRIALEAVAAKLGRDLAAEGVEVVPIGGAQAIRRAAAEYEGERVVGLCDAGEERWFRRVLGDATYVCVEDLEDELIRALGTAAVQEVVAARGRARDLPQLPEPARLARPAGRRSASPLVPGFRPAARSRYPPLLVEALEPKPSRVRWPVCSPLQRCRESAT